MDQTTRLRKTELEKTLQQRSTSTDVVTMRLLLEIYLDEAKERMVDSSIDFIRQFQGEAKAFRMLIRTLDRSAQE